MAGFIFQPDPEVEAAAKRWDTQLTSDNFAGQVEQRLTDIKQKIEAVEFRMTMLEQAAKEDRVQVKEAPKRTSWNLIRNFFKLMKALSYDYGSPEHTNLGRYDK